MPALAVTGEHLDVPPFTDPTQWALFAPHIAVIPNGCFLWIGPLRGDGYGEFTAPAPATRAPVLFGVDRPEPRRWGAHRWSYLAAHGPLDVRLAVMHACDEPLCVDPCHLAPGTAADNARHRQSRGRGACSRWGIRRASADIRGPYRRSRDLRAAVREHLAIGGPPGELPDVVAQADAAGHPHARQLTFDGLTA